MNRTCIVLILSLLPALAVRAAEPRNTGNDRGVDDDIASARKEVREELAKARAELDAENLDVGDGVVFGTSARHPRQDTLPKAEISRDGDFLLDGKAMAIDPGQRRELLAYRGLVVDIAKTGIDLGERSAQVALDAVDHGTFSLLVGALTGRLQRRVETLTRDTLQPGVLQICQRLPEVLTSQQRLAASLPQFRPYATLQAGDVERCESDVRNEFANL